MRTFNPELCYIGGKLERGKSIVVDGGSIIEIGEGNNSDKGLYLPGFVNAHSHAFQRGLRGRGETFPKGSNSFWGWREEMYRLVSEVDAKTFRYWCVKAFQEMRSAGITTVGEFHYLHHDEDNDYAFDDIVIEAAQEVGIRIVLLHAAYQHAGIHLPLEKEQQRFNTNTFDEWASQVETVSVKTSALERCSIGLVAHSIRAVDQKTIVKIADFAYRNGMPLHLHVEEQQQEIQASLDAYSKTPMRFLCDEIEISPLVTAVHCTHTAEADMEEWLTRGANVCICPLTEANLADGICDVPRIVHCEGTISLGTDSNARISMLEELRLLEYAQRLYKQNRGICINPLGDMGSYLIEVATQNGARCLGIKAGAIEVGKLADFTVIDLKHQQLEGVANQHLLAALCCGCDNSVISETIIGGQ